jgi:hypothetical protein
MIRIACTNCKTVLSIDDAFAGGVCRCQHCGTIQTVPARKSNAPGQTVGAAKSIYRGSKPDGSGTGLEELAEIVASSGLSGSGLTSRRLTKPSTNAPPPPAIPKNLVPIFVGVGVVILLLVIIIIWLIIRDRAASNALVTAPTSISQQQATPLPTICGINLNATSVIYLLDRGSSTQDYFASLKDATLKSAASLGSNRKFQIMFWSNGPDETDTIAYPGDSTAYASPDNVAAAQRTIEDLSASGATDVKPALMRALTHQPDVIVIATAKSYTLDDAWVQSLMELRGTSPVKIDFLSLGTDTPNPVLKSLADKTGGEYRDVTATDLRFFAGH